MLTDLSRDELLAYRSAQTMPADFDSFWGKTLAEAAEFGVDVRLAETPTPLTTITAYDVSTTIITPTYHIVSDTRR